MPRINLETLRFRFSRGIAASLLLTPAFLTLFSCSYAANIWDPEPRTELQQNLGSGFVLPVAGDSAWQVYRNPRLGFEIAIPKTRIVHSQEPYAQGVQFFGPAEAAENIGAWFGIYQPVRDSWVRAPNTFEQWYERYKKASSESGVNTILSEETIMVGGFSGLKVTSREDLTGQQQKFIIRTFIPVPVDRKDPSSKFYAVHVMLFGGPWSEAQKPKYLAVYDRMLSSLKFFNPTP